MLAYCQRNIYLLLVLDGYQFVICGQRAQDNGGRTVIFIIIFYVKEIFILTIFASLFFILFFYSNISKSHIKATKLDPLELI